VRELKIKTYETISTLALDGCENWSLISRKEHRWRVSEKRVLGGVIDPEREAVT
jgi:hypothetical protein